MTIFGKRLSEYGLNRQERQGHDTKIRATSQLVELIERAFTISLISQRARSGLSDSLRVLCVLCG